MKRLTCEMCGSTDLIKQDGVFVCQTCGCKYSIEEAKKMMVEGTVEVTGTVKLITRRQSKIIWTWLEMQSTQAITRKLMNIAIKSLRWIRPTGRPGLLKEGLSDGNPRLVTIALEKQSTHFLRHLRIVQKI